MLSLTQPYQPSPFAGSGRPAHRPFRGLLGVHSRCSPHTRHVTVFRDALVTRGFNRFVTSTVAPVASGWSISPGGTLTHWKAPPFHGAPTERPFTQRVIPVLRAIRHSWNAAARATNESIADRCSSGATAAGGYRYGRATGRLSLATLPLRCRA